jgi:phage baseplate assembly protein W
LVDRASNQKPSDLRLRGIAFPFQKKEGKFPYALTSAQQVKNDLILLFKTPINSRIMRPNEGSDADSLVFESQGELLNTQLRRSIRQTVLNSGINVSIISIQFSNQNTQTIAEIEYSIYGVFDNLTISVASNTDF